MSNDFHDVVFPSRLAVGIDAGVEMRVDVTRLSSGREQRNTRWSKSRRRYTLTIGQRPVAEIRAILNFFNARNGPLIGFRFFDPIDHSTAGDGQAISATDVEIGIGDGAGTVFPLSDRAGHRVPKPVTNTVKVALDGSSITSGFSINEDGAIEFDAAPATGTKVTAGFEFHVPVRFENEQIIATRTAEGAAQISDINLVEIYP